MPFFFFVWDEENEGHVAEHGVSREEFEDVVCNPYRVRRRYLACIYEMLDAATVYPITAYDPEE